MSSLTLDAGAAKFFGPGSYQQAADGPFSDLSFEYFHLETFEDGALNTPGVSANEGSVASAPAAVDSVDEDDGIIDGSGSGGNSWHSDYATNVLVFEFDAAALGSLPTHAGIVWTDSDNPTSNHVSFEAFDASGVSLGVHGPFLLGDDNNFGGTPEDRFLGVVEPGGVSAIRIGMESSNDWEVDHLQYGFAVLPVISKSGDNVVVKWPESTNNWRLQAVADLSSTNWSDVANAPACCSPPPT